MHILLAGATGTIGKAMLKTLLDDGHRVSCLVRKKPAESSAASLIVADFTSANGLEKEIANLPPFDAVISCIASRTGVKEDAYQVDYLANHHLLRAAQSCGIRQFILLSAICVQKPKLAFQKAKLNFEADLIASGLTWSIVRPTAFFKSLTGQIDRVRKGKPYLIFGNGERTRCKPISDRDLAAFICLCLTSPDHQNQILPIGGPGPVLTPKDIGEIIFKACSKTPSYKSVPPGFLKGVATILDLLGSIFPVLRKKAELARIGHYYATESMLLWDSDSDAYSASKTPSFGADTLKDHIENLVRYNRADQRGEHKAF